MLTLLTVVLSAYIRLAEVGIGCDDWPQCYAHLDPTTEKKGVTVLTEGDRDVAHYGARVAHRYIASVLGLCVLAIFAMALRRPHPRTSPLLVPVSLFAITVGLSLLGYYTPTRSNPLITLGNLLGGMALLALLWWMLQREVAGPDARSPVPQMRRAARVALGLVMLQIVLGGWASANYASASCPGLIDCHPQALDPDGLGQVFNPLREIELDAAGQVRQAESLGLLSMVHRAFALLTAGYLAWLVRRLNDVPALVPTVFALSLFSISQVLLGVSMIWLQLPLWMLTLHNALAAGLLLACVNLCAQLRGPPDTG